MTEQEKSLFEGYMRKCISLAKIAKERGESPVGSIIVRDGKIIGEGVEAVKSNQDITFHAEIEAIRRARSLLGVSDLSDCLLVSTHEPCLMCSYAIRHHKIPLLVIGLSSGEIGGFSSAMPILLDRSVGRWADPPRIIVGVLEEECLLNVVK